jgi:hypothetical protein
MHCLLPCTSAYVMPSDAQYRYLRPRPMTSFMIHMGLLSGSCTGTILPSLSPTSLMVWARHELSMTNL